MSISLIVEQKLADFVRANGKGNHNQSNLILVEIIRILANTLDAKTAPSLVDAGYNPTTMEDYISGQRVEGRGSHVTELPTGEILGNIDDLKYFNDKIMTTLAVPASYLETQNAHVKELSENGAEPLLGDAHELTVTEDASPETVAETVEEDVAPVEPEDITKPLEAPVEPSDEASVAKAGKGKKTTR